MVVFETRIPHPSLYLFHGNKMFVHDLSEKKKKKGVWIALNLSLAKNTLVSLGSSGKALQGR